MISLGAGLPKLEECWDELDAYTADLRNYYDPDVPLANRLDLLEAASAYLARALDIERCLYQREQAYSLPRGCPEQRFRTGALESFISMAKVLKDLGSRRLSHAQLIHDSEKTGRDQ